MSQKQTATGELKPTFLRLLKIYWSQFWRSILILIPIFICAFAYGAYMGVGPDGDVVYPNLKDIFTNKSSLLFYSTILVMLYFLQCLLFRLIIGNTYSDFTLSFVPKRDWTTPGFWPTLFHVSWAYFWRTSIIMILLRIVEVLYPNIFDSAVVGGITFIIEILIYTLLLHFIVNQQYGKVRLSLVKPEAKDG